ncbi:MAG: UTP--glucose-1-phosphate uridylyltransferase [Phycisphaerales bacterium]|nr:UTP--glucose-1-phosphate uridylyltransferase [Phycisphaerales bacterium]
MSEPILPQRFAETIRNLRQEHVLRFWPHLGRDQRAQLLCDLEAVPFAELPGLVDAYVLKRPEAVRHGDLAPAEVLSPSGPESATRNAAAWQCGVEAIRAGRVCAFTVAGGQGTRLGFDGPKGAYPISAVRNATLFQLFAESLRGVGRRWGHTPVWYIMTSPTNHADTERFFRAHGMFGLEPNAVRFFQQGQMPAFMPDGRIALADRHRLALSPDGHGGSLRALAASGALRDMQQRGIDIISYFQVDNPLVQTIDPLFVGFHIQRASEISSKAVRKASDTEKVGNFCMADGRLCVIEYSDMPESIARERNTDGSRRFDAGSIAIHLLNRDFVERLVAPGSNVRMPWHRADKRSPILVGDGDAARIESSDIVKLEMFIFDAIPLARNAMVTYVDRAEEFSPVKNAGGVDSPATTRRDLVRRAARWLDAAGCSVPRKPDGEPAATIEISPAFALDAADLRERLPQCPNIREGDRVVLE